MEIGQAPALGPGLKHPPVTVGSITESLDLTDGHAAGLLTVDILPCLHGKDGGQGVPMISGGHEDGNFRMDDCEVFECGVASMGRKAVEYVRTYPVDQQQQQPLQQQQPHLH